MIAGKFNCLLDQAYGSSGKGKISTYLADRYSITSVSSANFPNAGHTASFSNGTKFVAKAIPTAAILKKVTGLGMQCFLSPGSGFNWIQLIKEWDESGRPEIFIHSRASLVTPEHKRRESEGNDSTKHIASTMQGSAAAMVDKILRKREVQLAGTTPLEEIVNSLDLNKSHSTGPGEAIQLGDEWIPEFLQKVHVLEAHEFRNLTHSTLEAGQTWLHEGSQGYALSIDHGSHYPFCTARNSTLQAQMDYMAIPPNLVGDVYLNLRSKPIRVGNVVEDNVQKGFSGDFYPDCHELTWEQVAAEAGMPVEEARVLAERERTTVTKRIRRVATFSYVGLQDAVRTNGATKLIMNFIQYIDWKDNGLRDFNKLSKKSREFIDNIEKVAGVPVVLVGTGPHHDDIIVRENLL